MLSATAQKKLHWLLLALLGVFPFTSYAQTSTACDTSSRYLYWTGEENNDFFNEKNWRITNEKPLSDGNGKPTCFPGDPLLYQICPNVPDLSKDKYPKDKTLEPGQSIRINLYINAANVNANGAIIFDCAQKGITLINSQLNVTGGTMSQGVLSLFNESTVHLREGGFSPNLTLNFSDDASWVYTHQANPNEVLSYAGNIWVNNTTGTINQNFRINQYYQTGSIIRPLSGSYTPLKIFSDINRQGSAADLKEDIIYSGNTIPQGMDNAARSFTLKRGYMATFAINNNGTGKSRVYIASEEDLKLDALDVALQGNVSFIRVVPWNWVTKKGTGFYYDVNSGWYYNWNLNGTSKPNTEYVPMAWGAGGALPAAINQMIQNKSTTHVLGFNESDNCNDQSGQYNNLCQPAVAVAYYENLMSTGVRLGTPAPREQGPTSWLLEFNKIAKEKNVRFDFVAVHWYDWGSNPVNSPNEDPQKVFNRFKAYLEKVHSLYNLPIWITEFNANPNRTNAVQQGFLNLALPYLESVDYIERYAYFQPSSNNANYFDEGGNLTNIGTLYKNFTSTPSIAPATYVCPNNLDGLDQPYVAPPSNSIAFEAECGKFIGNQWDILPAEEASNGLYIRGNNNLTGVTALAKEVHFEYELANAGTYRVYIRSSNTGGNGALRIKMDGNDLEQISPFNSSSFTWLQIPRFYDLGVGKHRLTIEFPNSNLLLDQLVITTGGDDLESLKKESGYCTPATLKWGLEASDLVRFYEAESAASGNSWTTKTTVNAKGGAYVSSQESIMNTDNPGDEATVLNFTITADQTDEYDLWAKIQASATTESSLWIAVDDEPFRKWNNLSNPNYEWYWKKFYYSYGQEDRSFTYFLQAGVHQVKIAIASGNVAIDRLALVTKGKLPESTDPNVLSLQEKLEFEAEDATFLGTVTAQDCATASNGKLVPLGNVNTNGVRFSQIVAENAGAYKLTIAYMSKVARSFRLIVNGTIYGKQTVNPSGNWCYEGGSPANYEVTVQLIRGINNIDITPFSGDAPFIDKIKLEKADLNGLSLEAELAELSGSFVITSCTNAFASNGSVVNMGSTNGKIRFNNLLAPEPKTYQVDIHYITTVARNIRLSINGQPATTIAFNASGTKWCSDAGSVIAVNSVQLNFSQGINYIDMNPIYNTNAPFIDRIVIREPDPIAPAKTPTSQSALLMNETAAGQFTVYPNPINAGSNFTLQLPENNSNANNTTIQIADITGRIVLTQKLTAASKQFVIMSHTLKKGMYLVTMVQGATKESRKIIVQ